MTAEKDRNTTRMRLKPHEVTEILRMRGTESKDSPDYGVKRVEIKDNEMKQVLLSPENFKTTEDMAAYCKIDTSIWKVSKIVSNFWGSKDNPCWQYKVWWEKREDAFIDTKDIDWKYILSGIEKKEITDTRYLTGIKETRGHFDRLVITDHHIGMDTNKNGFSLFGGKRS